jgi:Tol biopolymer transport system component
LDDYVVDIDDGGSQGANAAVELNEVVLVTSDSVAGTGRFHLRETMRLGTSNTLRLRLAGKPGSFLAIQIIGPQDFIYFRRPPALGRIYRIRPDGSQLTQVTTEPTDCFHTWPAVSPDRTLLAFACNNFPNPARIIVKGLDGGTTRVLWEGPNAETGHLDWSPDGSQLARVHDSTLDIIAVDGSGITTAKIPGGCAQGARWSPRGDLIAVRFARHCLFFAPPSPTGTSLDSVELAVVRPDGTGLQLLTVLGRLLDGPPAWSPDGTRLAFVGAVPGQRFPPTSLWIVNADGSGLHQVVPVLGFYPTWSPDGSRVAFTSGDLFVINVDGTGLTQLTASRTDFGAYWR